MKIPGYGPALNNIPPPRHAEKSDITTLVLALKQRNTEQLTRIFWSVSDPHSLEYGKFLSLEEVTRLVEPHPGDIKVLMRDEHVMNVKRHHSFSYVRRTRITMTPCNIFRIA